MISERMLNVICDEFALCSSSELEVTFKSQYILELLRDAHELRAKLAEASPTKSAAHLDAPCPDGHVAATTDDMVAACAENVSKIMGRSNQFCPRTYCTRESAAGLGYLRMFCSNPPSGAQCVSDNPTFSCFDSVLRRICTQTAHRMAAYRLGNVHTIFTYRQVAVAEEIARIACARCIIKNGDCPDRSMECMAVFHTEATACLRVLESIKPVVTGERE